MLHLRVISPTEVTEKVVSVLSDDVGATALTVHPRVSREPVGDLVTADIARESANGILGRLHDLGLRQTGVVTLEQIDTSLSDAADRAEAAAPGSGQDAIVWEEVTGTVSEESELSWTYLAFLAIATAIAAIGLLLDQPILIVGAMVVGPDFGPLAGICVAIVHRQFGVLRRSVRALVIGFPAAVAVTVGLTLLGRVGGLVHADMLDRTRPLTSFVSNPDAFSLVVALLAGAAGMLSLTSAKSGALVGVAISVTTVPAAANAALAIALGEFSNAAGPAEQLAINLAGIVVAGVGTLLLQRSAWRDTRTESGQYT